MKFEYIEEIAPFTEEDVAKINQRMNAILNALRVSRDDLGVVTNVNKANQDVERYLDALRKRRYQK